MSGGPEYGKKKYECGNCKFLNIIIPLKCVKAYFCHLCSARWEL